MELKGWVRTSLIDYPDHIATVLFTGGCNLCCPMCHNADLVLRPRELETLPEDDIWEFLARRSGMVDGVVITGGEPTLQPDLPQLLERLQERGLHVKLDTNGTHPDVLKTLLSKGLVTYVALDVKAPLEKYPLLCGTPKVDTGRISGSITMLQESNIDHEFRTTVVPGLLDGDDIEAIARWIKGAKRYVLQQFRPVNTLDPSLEAATPYSPADLQAMARRALNWVPHTSVRDA